MAGALGIRLVGPRIYDGVLVDERWMGDGRSELTARRHPRGAASSIAPPAACRSRVLRDRCSCSALVLW